MDSVFPSFIGTGRHYSPVTRITTHDNRLSLQSRIFHLLDLGEEGIHIDMQDHTFHGTLSKGALFAEHIPHS